MSGHKFRVGDYIRVFILEDEAFHGGALYALKLTQITEIVDEGYKVEGSEYIYQANEWFEHIPKEVYESTLYQIMNEEEE